MRWLLGVLVLVALGLGATQAQSTPTPKPSIAWVLPESEWTPEAHLWLTRSLHAEAGFNVHNKRQEEHVALAYILVHRFEKRKAANPREHFVDTIRAYCNGMKKERKVLTPHMKWTRNLPAVQTQLDSTGLSQAVYPVPSPRYWPTKLRWTNYQEMYANTWLMLDTWVRGQLLNPCPGATIWGGPMDPRPAGLRRLACSNRYRNVMYGL